MMKVFSREFSVGTSGKKTYELTDQVKKLVAESGVKNGQVTVFVCHTSASLV